MDVNGNGRASSASPVGSSSTTASNISSATARGPRPPPPVRPKPKRTVTAPILPTMTIRSEFSDIVDEKAKSMDDQSADAPPRTTVDDSVGSTGTLTRGTVKALAERFSTTSERPQIPPPPPSSMVRSTVGLFESNGCVKEKSNGSKNYLKSVDSTGKISNSVELRNDSKSVAILTTKDAEPNSSKSHHRISAGGGTSTLLRFPKPSPPNRRQANSVVDTTTAGGSNSGKGNNSTTKLSSDHRALFETRRLKAPTSASIGGKRGLRRNRSCDVGFDRRGHDRGDSKSALGRRHSVDNSDIPTIVEMKFEKPRVFNKKTPPPVVPPKPSRKKPSVVPSTTHDYEEYDVIPGSITPMASSTPEDPPHQQEEKKRRSLPAVERQSRQLPQAPAQLYDQPVGLVGRRSLGTPTNPPSAFSTMELLDDSQLNISGHIYCAVRHGEVIEDEEGSTANRNLANHRSIFEDEDDSFSASVFGAIELATGRKIATDAEDSATSVRIVDEDAMTNYEEIMEDSPLPTNHDAQIGSGKSGAATLPEDHSKWETCSSLTSTSADSASSSTNVPAPMLIAFRRRLSNDRHAENRITECSLTEEQFHAASTIDDPSPAQTIASYSPSLVEKRDRESKSVPRPPGARLSRHARPKSQLDLAANSLWRIKSDIQLNLSQAMGKIRLKVSSSNASVQPPSTGSAGGHSPNLGKSNAANRMSKEDGGGNISTKKADQKTRSTFYLPSANASDMAATTSSSHPTSISITLEAGLADEIVSSTAASSDEEDDEDEEDYAGAWDEAVGEDDTTPTAATSGPNLPDLVPLGSRKNGASTSATTTDSSSSPATTTADGPRSTTAALQSQESIVRPPLFSETSTTLAESERFEMVYNSRFAFSEPVYQHYLRQTAATVQRNLTFSENDGKGTISRRDKLLNTSQLGSQRTLWCELPEVIDSGLLQQMSDEERKLMEALFEVISSEASYLRSLNILILHFVASPHLSGNTSLGSCVSRQERKQLFSNILAIRDCTETLLSSLEDRLKDNVVLDKDVCDILHKHLGDSCEIYVKYCSNQIYQERVLNELRRINANFRQVISQLETNPVCESLDLRSFLMLPMQRVTRYPLLLRAILERSGQLRERNEQLLTAAQRVSAMALRVVGQCNEGAKKLERIEQLVELDKTLVYQEDGPKRIGLVSSNHWLVKKGAAVQLLPRRNTLGVRGGLRHRRVYLFLLTDLLLIAKATEGDRRFVVKDYCPRIFVELTPLEPSCPQIPEGANLPANACLILCTLMRNHRERQAEFLLNCESETDKERWLEAIRPKTSQESDDDRIYESWDCPQVKVVTEYRARQEDELDLEVDEIINVFRKMKDGWYEGARTDGKRGWFPGHRTKEIVSDHVRARNYRERFQLIQEAERIQRSIYVSSNGDSSSNNMAASSTTLASSSSGGNIGSGGSGGGTNSRRSSIIPNAAKGLFRF